MDVCAEPDCEGQRLARGLCPKHYWRLMNHGSTADRKRPIEERFWSKVDKRGPDECWLWIGTINPKQGRGMFAMGSRKDPGGIRFRRAHRVAYELTVGPIAAGLEIDHLCHNPICVNPSHLEPVTPAENKRRQAVYIREQRPTCKRGHLFDTENTGISRGKRYCRQCNREKTWAIRYGPDVPYRPRQYKRRAKRST